MRWAPPGLGGERRPPEKVKQDGWREQGLLAVSVDDQRLSWPERELIRQIGEKLYGCRQIVGMPTMDKWTIEMVEQRLGEAADVMRRLPPVRVSGYFNTWPRMLIEFADRVGQQAEPMRLPPPSASAISRMEEALTWLRWLEVDDVKLVWARSDRKPWKVICWQFGVSRATANRRWQFALSVIAWRLNGRSVSAKRSRGYIVEQARAACR